MIKIIEEDIFTATDGLFVHGCNCQGVMGAGVAAGVRAKWPYVYKTYAALCEQEDPKDLLGTIQIVSTTEHGHINDAFRVVNAFTQLMPGFGRQVSYDAIATCFEELNSILEIYRDNGITYRLIFPKIGAGLAGGSWNVIERIIDESVSDDFEKVLYVPKGLS